MGQFLAGEVPWTTQEGRLLLSGGCEHNFTSKEKRS